MSYLQAIVFGVIQGATEWLPISSTAHLRVAPALLGWKDPGAAFDAVIQLGTLLAALVYFWRDIVAIVTGRPPRAGSDDIDGRRLLIPIIVGSVPVVVAGLAFHHAIEGSLRSLWVIAAAMIGFALLLAVAERRRSIQRSISTVTVLDGLIVGIGQMLALIPGASRSGSTITAALFVGIERSAAARFSFLLSLPAVAAAGLFELVKQRHAFASGFMAGPTLVATLVSFIVGWATIHWLLAYLRSRSTWVFIGYRVVAGLAIYAMLSAGVLSALAGQ